MRLSRVQWKNEVEFTITYFPLEVFMFGKLNFLTNSLILRRKIELVNQIRTNVTNSRWFFFGRHWSSLWSSWKSSSDQFTSIFERIWRTWTSEDFGIDVENLGFRLSESYQEMWILVNWNSRIYGLWPNYGWSHFELFTETKRPSFWLPGNENHYSSIRLFSDYSLYIDQSNRSYFQKSKS